MQNDSRLTDRQFLFYTFVDCGVTALKAGWSHRAPASWTWTTRSELELLTQFYYAAFAASQKITEKVQESLFEADMAFTSPAAAAKAFWMALEASFEVPWDKVMVQRMRVSKRNFEDRVKQIEKVLASPIK
jgi:hypothetical protein